MVESSFFAIDVAERVLRIHVALHKTPCTLPGVEAEGQMSVTVIILPYRTLYLKVHNVPIHSLIQPQ